MSAAHYFTHSSGYCFPPANGNPRGNGVFTPSNNNIPSLRLHLAVALGSKSPAYFASPTTKPCPVPKVIESCNIANMLEILTFGPTTYTTCVTNFWAAFGASFYATINAQVTLLTQFQALLTLVSNLAQAYGPNCTTESFQLHVIFDNKIDVNWGQLVNSAGTFYRDPTPLVFPDTFETFELVIYANGTKQHFSASPALKWGV